MLQSSASISIWHFLFLTPYIKDHDMRCHFHEVSCLLNLAASVAGGRAETISL
jgi:hypothetical protein